MLRRLVQRVRGLLALLAISVSGAAAATVGAVEPAAWRFAHPEAQIVAGVDFRKLLESPTGKQVREQFSSALGAPLLEQAERMLLSSVVDASGRRSDILILSGSFSLAHLRKMAMREGAQMVPFKGLEIAAPPGATAADPHLAWVTGPGSGTTVLIGTRPAIQAAGERGRLQLDSMASINDLFARAHEMAAQYPIWIACEAAPRGFGPSGLDQMELDGFDVAVQTANGGAVNLWFWTEGEKAAGDVLRRLQAATLAREPFLLSAWLPEMGSGIEEGTLVLRTTTPGAASAARVGALLAAFALPVDVKAPAPASSGPALGEVRAKVAATVPVTGLTTVQGASTMPVAAPAQAAPQRLFVRIEGLDEGVKDIPYTPKP